MGTEVQLSKGILEGCVLRFLKDDFLFSAEIVAAMCEAGFDFSEGTLYPMLLRLEKDGCFLIAKVASPTGAPKKYYKLSPHGLERLAEFEEAWKKMSENVNHVLGGKDHAES